MGKAYLILREVVAELTERVIEIVGLTVPEEIEKLLLRVFIDYIIDILIFVPEYTIASISSISSLNSRPLE